MPMNINRENAAAQFAQALSSNDQQAIEQSWTACMDAIAQRVLADFEAVNGSSDQRALAERGCRQLTAAETDFYQRFADAARGSKQEFQNFLSTSGDGADGWMPETVIEDVFRNLQQDHPVISRVKFQYVGYSGKWIVDDSSVKKGAWGTIDAKITADIQGALKVIDLTQNKYTAFVVIPLAILDLGPVWIDSYVRSVLTEAVAAGIEEAIVSGSGVNQPVGLMRDPNSAFDQTNGYAEKTPVKVTSFAPAEYGDLVSKLSKTEKGRTRKFGEVQLLCNMSDYLTKIMPATTTLATDGTGYARDLFPFPTEPLVSNAVPDGKAVMCLLGEYTLGAGSTKNGATDYDDSIGFLDHTRTYRNVNYFAGRATDNTCAVVLDISDLDPAYITVKTVDAAAAAVAEPAAAAADAEPAAKSKKA